MTRNSLDGVDVDYEDSLSFESSNGNGEQWLIDLTNQLRSKLPNSIITHSPKAPYFMGTQKYPRNAYLKVHQDVGPKIQFYNVQFYNQGSASYNTTNTLFNNSGSWAYGTSVN